jgi:hypothetical protein
MPRRGGGLRRSFPVCVALGVVWWGCPGSIEPGRQGGTGGGPPMSPMGGNGSGGVGGSGGTSTASTSSGGSGTGGTAGATTVGTGGRINSGGSVAGGTVGSGGKTSGGSGGSGGATSSGGASTSTGGSGGRGGTGGSVPVGSGGANNNGTGGTGAGGGSGGGTGGVPACPSSGFAWPNGAEAAVSLTYDDTLTSQLDNALPAIDQQGLKMTFFLVTNNNLDSAALRARYAAALAAGHELASHSVTHPCDTASYTLATMDTTELDPSLATLRSMGATAPFTYAYPCGTNTVGSSQSYIPEVKARFIAARGVSGIIANPKTVDLGNTPGLFPPEADTTGATAIGYVTDARSQKGWVIFGFHGVGGDYSIYPKTGHDALVQYLGANKAKVWTATFRDVAAYVAKCR